MLHLFVKIKRQAGPEAPSHWTDFRVVYRPNMTVVDVLVELRLVGRDARDESVPPVVWDEGCAGGACGACAMMINGKPQLACLTKVDLLKRPIRLAPLSKFPVLKDLLVDMERVPRFAAQLQVIPLIEDFERRGPLLAGQVEPSSQQVCIDCGICLEVCPRTHEQSPFVGPKHLWEAWQPHNELALHGPGGLVDCGQAENCTRYCPQHLPLSETFAELKGRQFRSFLKGHG